MKMEKLKKGHAEGNILSDKNSNPLHQPDTASPNSASATALKTVNSSPATASSAVAERDSSYLKEEERRKSLLRRKFSKSVSEYKEVLSDLKEKIQGKISKTVETRVNSTPDKEPKLSGTLNKTSKRLEIPTSGSHKEVTSFTSDISDSPIKQISRSKSFKANKAELQEIERTYFAPQPLKLNVPSVSDGILEKKAVSINKKWVKPDYQDFLHNRSELKIQTDTVGKIGSPVISSMTHTCDAKIYNGEHIDAEKLIDSVNLTSTSAFQLINLNGRLFQWIRLMLVIIFMLSLFTFLFSSYLSGLILGCTLMSMFLKAHHFLMRTEKNKDHPKLIPLKELPPFAIPEMKRSSSTDDDIYKGWMFMKEIKKCNPSNFHLNNTRNVFITLEKTKLRLQQPGDSVPLAMLDESTTSTKFIQERHLELKGSRVYLQPSGLIKSKLWSKKYPICLSLADAGKENELKEFCDKSDDSTIMSGSACDKNLELTSEENLKSSLLFLFAHTGREKEEWFHRFQAATKGKPFARPMPVISKDLTKHQGKICLENASSIQSNTGEFSVLSVPAAESFSDKMKTDPVLEFTQYMERLMPSGDITSPLDASYIYKESGYIAQLSSCGSFTCDNQLHWLNALIGRCFFDFLRDAGWADKVRDKLQRKINKIHVPYFIEELQVTAIDLGREMPVLKQAAYPYLDERGFWVELDVSYGGGFTMTIETKVNLMKLKRTSPQSQPNLGAVSERSSITFSDEDDNAESSTEDEEDTNSFPEEKESGGSKERLLKYLDKLTSSKYFQQATEYKYIKRAMENVSKTPLQLQTSVKTLTGKLAINIPPPPTDRLWYGFRGPPVLLLVAKPQVGERVVKFTHITDWIERRLELEFQRIFVMPNMDDLIIPILKSSQD